MGQTPLMHRAAGMIKSGKLWVWHRWDIDQTDNKVMLVYRDISNQQKFLEHFDCLAYLLATPIILMN